MTIRVEDALDDVAGNVHQTLPEAVNLAHPATCGRCELFHREGTHVGSVHAPAP